ncbi:hypothetical protein Vadar_012712 [Vaccinium darrowii]|uniref:Uncharacterized protein n=1 Tax=Vaccinium darrowii TaxID=229202 RepID=A0ACB7XR36_9ERIC|nr:hypothetical protein Vadar_012712 [Vaccinium darrowii]
MTEDTPREESLQIKDTVMSTSEENPKIPDLELTDDSDEDDLEEDESADDEEEVDGIPVVKLPRRETVTNDKVAQLSNGPNSGRIAHTPAYGHWTLVQRKPRRPNTGRRFTDRSHMVQSNKPPRPNSQKMESRENRFSPLNGLDASPSGTKQPNPPNGVALETRPSQPSWAKVKNGNSPKENNTTFGPSQPSHNPNPNISFNPPQAVSLKIPNLIDQNISPPTKPTSTPQTSQPISPHQPTLQLVPNGNRDIPSPPSADLHPDQTRGRRRSTSKSGMVKTESEDGSNSTRVQRSRSPILRGGSGKPQRNSEGPDGDVLVLVETKVPLASLTDFFSKKGFTANSFSDPVGHFGGIWVLWNPINVAVSAVEVTSQAIHATISRVDCEEWIFTAVYGSPNPTCKDLMWYDLQDRANNDSKARLLAGDFNDHAKSSKRMSFQRVLTMDPALYEAVLHVGVDIQITPNHNTMDQPNVLDAQLAPNHNPLDSNNLYDAVKDGNVQNLDQYVDLFDTYRTPNHNTILHVAAHFGKLYCVAKILEKKPYLIQLKNSNNEYPLHVAVREKHYDVVKTLIDHAKELSQDPESGCTTRSELLRSINVHGDTTLHLAVQEGDAKIVRLLVKEDPDFVSPKNMSGRTPLYLAAEREDGYSMVVSILAGSQSPIYTGPRGRTALHASAISGNEGSLLELLDRIFISKDLIDQADIEGWTPLHYASHHGNYCAARLLLRRDKSIGYTRTPGKLTALHIAAAANNKWGMEEILSECSDCWEMVNDKGRNILHIAVDAEAERVVEFIMKTDWLESLINQKDFEGNTPLHLVASSDMKDMDALINHPRANLYAMNNKNKTPLDVAISVGKKRRKEYREKLRAKQAEALKKLSKNHMLVATLIATITFAAAFTIPGGYEVNQGPEEGMAVLVRQASFKAFVIANTIAVMCSTSSVVYYVYAGLYYFDDKNQGKHYEKGFYLVLIAIITMTVSFISGTYAMLVHSLGLAIATSIIASTTFLIYFVELIQLFGVWLVGRSAPWQQLEE